MASKRRPPPNFAPSIKLEFVKPPESLLTYEEIEREKQYNTTCELNMNFITDNIAISNYDSAKRSAKIKGEGITHILNVSEDTYKPKYTTEFGFTYMFKPFEDNSRAHLISHLPDTLNFIHTAVLQGGKVLVHCAAGISRSVSIVIAYLMWSQKNSLDTILELVQDKRKCANPNENFRAQLLIFEDAIKNNPEADIHTVCQKALELYPNPPSEEGIKLHDRKKQILSEKLIEYLKSKYQQQSGGYKKQQRRKTKRSKHTTKTKTRTNKHKH